MECYENELVSIIIPTYKRSYTLQRAIESVVNQTYSNIEIIVVDDNANYSEIRKANRRLIKNFKNIVFIENEVNLGGGLSRNEGLKHASGKYVCFLDDDDEFLPTKVEEQYNLYRKLQNNNIAMIYCYANMINVDGSRYEYKKDLEGNLLLENTINCIAATSWWFCPKDKLMEVGGFENISSRQDASLLLKLFLKGYEVYRVPKILLNYYWHDSNSGITKIDNKTKIAEEQYKKLFIDRVEEIPEPLEKQMLYVFSYRLACINILLRKRKSAFRNLCEMLRINIVDKRNFRVFCGVLLNELYCYVYVIKNRRRVGR